MSLGKIAVYARKIHRILVLFITALGLTMMVTGLTLHEGNEKGEATLLNYNVAWSIHGVISVIFALFLTAMIATGLFLYSYPWIQKMIRKNPPSRSAVN